ncbi:MAG: aminotransferase class III-fold pyridoxal phosphate-dependent enzyme, partial [Verrucomicrobiota bacterium]|nr:aminotransferase class III-fold pyridoxal phosphate-dependent enzyme [Verrucomicrobiota bacterium]
TTTHAAHPVSCAAALANLDVFEKENLVAEAERKGRLVEPAMAEISARFPDHIARHTGAGLLWTFHARNPATGELDLDLAAEWTWATVRRGVMVFHTMRPSIKICPPLTIPDDALLEGIEVMGEALESLVN